MLQAEKKRKQEEAAARAKQAAEEAQKVLEALKGREGSEAPNSTVPDPATATPAPEQGNKPASFCICRAWDACGCFGSIRGTPPGVGPSEIMEVLQNPVQCTQHQQTCAKRQILLKRVIVRRMLEVSLQMLS